MISMLTAFTGTGCLLVFASASSMDNAFLLTGRSLAFFGRMSESLRTFQWTNKSIPTQTQLENGTYHRPRNGVHRLRTFFQTKLSLPNVKVTECNWQCVNLNQKLLKTDNVNRAASTKFLPNLLTFYSLNDKMDVGEIRTVSVCAAV